MRRTLAVSPSTGLAQAIEQELGAGVAVSRAAFLPQLSLQGGTGQSLNGSFHTSTYRDYWADRNVAGAWRNDVSLSGSQLIYDFGASRSDLDRAVKARDAQSLRVMAAAEEAALSAAQAYVKVQESRELLALAKENLVALQGIETLISRSEQNGNGTQADMKRVRARVVDAESTVVDQDLDLKVAIEKFRRLAQTDPDGLQTAPTLQASLPANAAQALTEAAKSSPQLLAGSIAVSAAQAEVSSIVSADMPRLGLTLDASQKNYRANRTRSEVDATGLLTLTYKLADGGMSSAKREQASARITQAEMRLASDRLDVELAVRQGYLQLSSLRAKAQGLGEGVSASAKARELYREQFTGGKRSLLELLEVQTSYYTARYNAITNGYEQRRVTYAILKAVGGLRNAVARRA